MPWIRLRSCFPLGLCLFPWKYPDWLQGQWCLPKHPNSSYGAYCVMLHFPISATVSPFLLHVWAYRPNSTAEGLLQPLVSVTLTDSLHIYWTMCRAVDLAWDLVFHWEEKPQPKAEQINGNLKGRILREGTVQADAYTGRNCASWYIQKKESFETAIGNWNGKNISIEMGVTSVSFCNFGFVFLGTKGTIVFCCSEISGQMGVFQHSSVVGPENLLPSWTGYMRM